jgi:exportin-2 (importin alpha re-exporter)
MQICEGIIIPNVKLREDDKDDFENNFQEFLRWDLEGSDSETRRRCAADFVKCLVDTFPAETTRIIMLYVDSLLAQYSSAPEVQWTLKNCAVYMFMALAVRGKTLAAGATTVNEKTDVEQFFREHILPELATEDVGARPVLKADALRCELAGLCLCYMEEILLSERQTKAGQLLSQLEI